MLSHIGILGGLSRFATCEYYQHLIDYSQQQYGQNYYLPVTIYHLDYKSIYNAAIRNKWQEVGDHLIEAGACLQRLGASHLVIPCNSLHYLAAELQQALSMPVISIVSAVKNFVERNFYRKIGILATDFTHEFQFYQQEFFATDVELVTLPSSMQQQINNIIFKQLCNGIVTSKANHFIYNAINYFAQLDCDAVLLACTDLTIFADEVYPGIAVLDSLTIHTRYIINTVTS